LIDREMGEIQHVGFDQTKVRLDGSSNNWVEMWMGHERRWRNSIDVECVRIDSELEVVLFFM